MYNTEIKNTMFADDATFLLDGTNKSFEKLIYIIDEFSKMSGLKLNTKKYTVLHSKTQRIFYAQKRTLYGRL